MMEGAHSLHLDALLITGYWQVLHSVLIMFHGTDHLILTTALCGGDNFPPFVEENSETLNS